MSDATTPSNTATNPTENVWESAKEALLQSKPDAEATLSYQPLTQLMDEQQSLSSEQMKAILFAAHSLQTGTIETDGAQNFLRLQFSEADAQAFAQALTPKRELPRSGVSASTILKPGSGGTGMAHTKVG